MVESDGWIEVADPGPGERRRIFQAFHKSSHEAAETKPGVGLGLAPSRRLASSLGGELSGESSETGACFGSSTPAEKA
jgi:K+-sensing histidine kinase KdpD